ncbi:FepA family TonB-dependent siderophore receptor [Limoniibacter endophyticus]|uniref:Outer membrane receptor FepA n=1 Tax=Limoniibacter endophyticus TaxID=1565040 RepID=A0A8J3DML1_9HYPH|nr:FepA family TonB-dependent siderophore receptor [Limoniibacter endophyticus]GHC64139.1 outer membrane receptor FepA [Limoniibacter endophyticus]
MSDFKFYLRRATALSLLLAATAGPISAQEMAETDDEGEITLDRIIVLSAEEQLKQAPGVSTITSEDLEKQPVANDLSEIIRKMPGVNLTGTTSSGQRGNQRQIDIRGMGPENTLILIDGKPVLSRNSVRMGRAGERDSRGDSNWVPAEMVERIEVLRGPAAARYGSGASGGVVNIITKRPETTTGQFSVFGSMPQHSEEGYSIRANAMVGGPITDVLSYRIIASIAKTDADDPDINAGATLDPTATPAAGREGVVNKDLRGLLTYEFDDQNVFDFEAAYSRQGNIFAGDRQLASVTDLLEELANQGAETNTMTRTTLSATHRGFYDFAESNSYIQWEQTRNTRFGEGTAGRYEGAITDDAKKGTITLDNLTAKSEWDIPLTMGYEQKLTLGGEFRGEWMEDGVSNQLGLEENVVIPGTDTDPENRDPNTNAWMFGLYAEDNIYINDRLILTPGLRGDYHSEFGGNLSPSLNASYQLSENLTLKAGIARAFKAPNLFQLNPNYVYYTRGNGCPIPYPTQGGVGCYVVGNPNLDPETSINKEIGLNYHDDLGWNAGVTYFHNDYKDRIASGLTPIDTAVPGAPTGWVFRWENVPEAVVSGLEGNLSIPVLETLTWSTNATYMIESENKQNGQPLSLVPEYTINTALDWQAREDLTLTLSATHYGKTPSPTLTGTTGAAVENPLDRDPYTVVNVGLKYDYNDNFRVSAGVTNVFDERLFREGSGNAAGANTYNEPGRAFYLSVTGSF